MTKKLFTTRQLEAALQQLRTIDDEYPDYPVSNQLNSYDMWSPDSYPIQFKNVGEEKNVRVRCHEHFGGEEGGDHRMYIILAVGYGSDTRYFQKTGEYNSWESSEWDGYFTEVESKQVTVTEWVAKK